jgi:hypothetical protein
MAQAAVGRRLLFSRCQEISRHAAKGPKSTLVTDSVEKVENAAKTKFSQKLAGGRFLLRMRSSCEEEGRRKLLFKPTWSTVSDGVKRISGS